MAVALAAAGCGSRVTAAQVQAYRAQFQGSGSSGGAALSQGGPAAGGSTAASSPLGGSSSGSTPGGSGHAGASSNSGASGSGTAVGGGSTATSVAGSTATSLATSGATGGGGNSQLYAEGMEVDPAICKGTASGPGIKATEIDVGNVSTITGPVPGLSAGAAHGATAFAAYLNSVGGICGRRLVVKTADDDLDASQNSTATQSLVGSSFAMVGSDSGVDQGGAPALKSSDIPDIGEALSPQRFDLPNNFSPQPIPPTGYGPGPYVYLAHKYPQAVTHMAILALNQPTAIAETQAMQHVMEASGWKFIYSDFSIEPTQTDFSADAQAMKSKGVQGVVILAVPTYYADVARAVQNAGMHMVLPNYAENAYDPSFIADAGSAANGTILAAFYAMYDGEDASSVPLVSTFDRWYEGAYNTRPDEFAVDGWLSGMLFVEGLNRGGGLTRADLLKGLSQVTSFDGGGLEGTANPAGKTPPQCYLIVDVVNGKFVRDPVDPRTGLDCQYAGGS
ncbi:MAG TPA: ABC transporter substrate-binding protein [Acidimicrobiales bacterium]|jgi:ABC-type branched-subunit amino acid transport system substrate-binding protein|nr:ABC transporter substrate-binding protein [Acidimicrobiales bacterium]